MPLKIMPPRIAIPMPHSTDREYAARSVPQYEHAIQQAGGEPVRIPLDQPSAEVVQIIESCDGVLLPGSKADVDPAEFGAQRSPHTAAADQPRHAVDQLLLENAYRLRKPVLGICYGLQSLNVYRAGSLIQHIPDFLPESLHTKVNHEAGRTVAVAHTVEIEGDSRLAEILNRLGKKIENGIQTNDETGGSRDGSKDREGHGFSRANTAAEKNGALAPEASNRMLAVNSSHHQSAGTIGDGLRIAARCPDDGIVEALEGTAPDHFVFAVQWHPERSVDDDEASLALFRALICAAQTRQG
jgi:putative glutamine amidotransferase